jgi:hypothetical protein
MKLGLDELMIVNPGPGDLEAKGPSGRAGWAVPAQYFLGADGSLYQVQGVGSAELAGADEPVGGFFLGDDGTLYQVVPERPR